MNDALSHVTLGQVAVVGLVLAGVVRFGGRVWAWVVRAVHFVDKLESIERQVLANGGSSLRDAVDQVARTQAALAEAHIDTSERLDTVAAELGSVRTVLEQHMSDSARLPRRADDPPEADFRPVTHGGERP